MGANSLFSRNVGTGKIIFGFGQTLQNNILRSYNKCSFTKGARFSSKYSVLISFTIVLRSILYFLHDTFAL